MRYTENEYDYESLVKKFMEGLKISIKYKISFHEHVLSYPDFEYGNISDLSANDFNEDFFFVVYKHLVKLMLEHKYGGMNDYKLYSYKNTEEIWENIYDIVEKNIPQGYINYLSFPFSESYKLMIYAISRAVSIDISNNDWINIKYDKEFLENIKIYDEAHTTNYYVGQLKTKKDINYLYDQVLGKGFKKLNSDIIDRSKTLGQEFEIHGRNNILFGGTYEDKVFLKSIINWSGDELKRIKPTQNLNFNDYEVDIVGLSTKGDNNLIDDIINTAKKDWHLLSHKRRQNWVK